VRDRSSSSREIVNNEISFCEISITRESDLNRRLTFLLQFPTLSRQYVTTCYINFLELVPRNIVI